MLKENKYLFWMFYFLLSRKEKQLYLEEYIMTPSLGFNSNK